MDGRKETSQKRQSGLGELIDLFLSEYSGYTLELLIDEVTLAQFCLMIQAIRERQKKEFLERMVAFRVGMHADNEQFMRIYNEVFEYKEIIEQAKVLSERLPGFGIEKK